jgi:hypothetical protein
MEIHCRYVYTHIKIASVNPSNPVSTKGEKEVKEWEFNEGGEFI